MKPNRRFNIPGAAANASLGAALLLAAVVLLFGCGKTSLRPSGPDPSGVYALISVNSTKVPASVAHEGATLQVRSGTFTINADGTCDSKIIFVPPSGIESTRKVKATYTQDGAKLRMKWEGAGITTGTIHGDTFTMNNEGMVFAYQK
jgi:hypothetical protein